MNRLALIVLVAVLIVLAMFEPWRSEVQALAPPAPEDVVAERPAASLPEVQHLPELLIADSTAQRKVIVAAEDALESEDQQLEGPLCIMFGRLVDEDGQALPGIHVRWYAKAGWAEGVKTEPMDERWAARGFTTETDSEGLFRFEKPVPIVTRTFLKILPDPFHDSQWLFFDSNDQRHQPSLTEGTRDLGDIQLATTGALRGRVINEQGMPLAEVKMGVGQGVSSTFGRDVYTDAEGLFLLGHAPTGTYMLKAKVEGYLTGFKESVTVEPHRETSGMDFTLIASPSIEGIVVDEFGIPVEGVRLWGWPSTSGSGAGAKSGVDGRFVVSLPQVEPYTMKATRDGYEPWGEGRSVLYDPGTRDLRIAMQSIVSMRFSVVDDETGSPIERFGLSIYQNEGSKAKRSGYTERRRPPGDNHPNGVAEATARVGVDAFLIAAEGYMIAEGDVYHDADGMLVQTVRLRRGATLSGRALIHGAPVVGAQVGVQRYHDFDGRVTLDRRERHSTATDAEGRFQVDALPIGKYKVTVTPLSGAPSVFTPDALKDREVRDLGDLVLVPGARIEGIALLPPGIDPTGLEVHVGSQKRSTHVRLDSAGHFLLANLAPGDETLELGGRPGVLESGAEVEVTLVSGETLHVTLDAREFAMCHLTLDITIDGFDEAGINVYGKSVSGESRLKSFGKCDPNGRVTGFLRGDGEVRISVHIPKLGFVEHPDARFHLTAGGSVQGAVHFQFASLAISLPREQSYPTDGFAILELTPVGQETGVRSVRLRFKDGAPAGNWAGFSRFENEALKVTGQTPGQMDITLKLVEVTELSDAPLIGVMHMVIMQDGEMLSVAEPYYTGTSQGILDPSQVLLIQLK